MLQQWFHQALYCHVAFWKMIAKCLGPCHLQGRVRWSLGSWLWPGTTCLWWAWGGFQLVEDFSDSWYNFQVDENKQTWKQQQQHSPTNFRYLMVLIEISQSVYTPSAIWAYCFSLPFLTPPPPAVILFNLEESSQSDIKTVFVWLFSGPSMPVS